MNTSTVRCNENLFLRWALDGQSRGKGRLIWAAQIISQAIRHRARDMEGYAAALFYKFAQYSRIDFQACFDESDVGPAQNFPHDFNQLEEVGDIYIFRFPSAEFSNRFIQFIEQPMHCTQNDFGHR